jgi:Spy/CpxP family protein refolding chaperone
MIAVLTLALCATAAAMAQAAPQAPLNEDDAILIAQSGSGEAPSAMMQDREPGPPGMAPHAGMMKRREPMKFWNNSEIATKIKLTDDQKQKLETTFTNYRLKLIDQRAAVEREEVKLQPLVQADKLDEAAITRQIDSLISARGQLERSSALMGVDIRKVLTTDQWKQLKDMHAMGFGFGHGVGERSREHYRMDRRSGDGQAPPPPPPQGDDDKGPK